MGLSKPNPSEASKMGISQDKWHKRRKTGGRQTQLRKKRKCELGRPPANTKLGPHRVHTVRTMGGNTKYRALRLDHGNFSWGSEAISRKTRVIDVVYNASNNEAVRTKSLMKSCVVQIDATPLGRRKGVKLSEEDEAVLNKKRSKRAQRKYDERKKTAWVEQALDDQFAAGKIFAKISSRPGQCGRIDGYILEGKELEFYSRKMKTKRK